MPTRLCLLVDASREEERAGGTAWWWSTCAIVQVTWLPKSRVRGPHQPMCLFPVGPYVAAYPIDLPTARPRRSSSRTPITASPSQELGFQPLVTHVVVPSSTSTAGASAPPAPAGPPSFMAPGTTPMAVPMAAPAGSGEAASTSAAATTSAAPPSSTSSPPGAPGAPATSPEGAAPHGLPPSRWRREGK